MDFNSPIYREKYLKYKNKYLELKSLEGNQSAGMFASFKKGLSSASASMAKATGTDPQSYYNASVMNLFKTQVTEVHTFGTDLVKGLPVAQQTNVTKSVYDMLANGIMGHGPVAKAISAITGTHDSKGPIEGVTVPSAADKLNEILLEQLKTSDVISYAKPLLNEGLATVHANVMSQVLTVEIKTANSKVTGLTLKNLNDQLVVEKLCNTMGLEVSACDKKKIDAAKWAFKELETINKNKITSTKSAETFDKTRIQAQKAMDDFANSLYENATSAGLKLETPETVTTITGLQSAIDGREQGSLASLREKLELPGDKSSGLTKESLIEAFAKPDYHIPANFGVSPTPPASPKAATDVPLV